MVHCIWKHLVTIELLILERHVDGSSFIELTREDFSILYPSNEKFLLGSKLYKIAMSARTASEKSLRNTNSLLDEMEEVAYDSSSSQASMFRSPVSTSRGSTPVCASTSTSRASTPLSVSHLSTLSTHPPTSSQTQEDESERPIKKRCMEFKLPVFSPDIKQCIRKDAFYSSTQRNRLIKEACLALRGYCWEKEQEVTNIEKRKLAKLLYEIAPKSLGDSGKSSKPEVRI